MRKLFTVLAAILLTASVFAQSPEKMSYQAVIRNSSDVLVTNTQIGMEINIRQATPAGTIVYTETQTPTTNANGLVSIEIGGGTGFDTIKWANGPYFIETKTAVVPPLTTYTITGTSQLLSVPYALYAKTARIADTARHVPTVAQLWATGGISSSSIHNTNSGSVGIGTASPAFSALLELNSTSQGLLLSRLSCSQILAITSPVEGLVVYNKTIKKLVYYNGSNWANGDGTPMNCPQIGNTYAGGIIFYLDSTGEHGLVCAPSDQATNAIWYNGTYTVTGATASGVGLGAGNTATIIANQGAGNYAASICHNLALGGYTDWYLPSLAEMNLIRTNLYLNGIGGFDGTYYWSSTELNANQAYEPNLGNGINYTGNKSYDINVRAVRAF